MTPAEAARAMETCWGCRHCFNGTIPIYKQGKDIRASACTHPRTHGRLVHVDEPPPVWCQLRPKKCQCPIEDWRDVPLGDTCAVCGGSTK